MIHKGKKLIYIPIPKTGSTSLRKMLEQLGFQRMPNNPRGGNHLTVKDCIDLYKESNINLNEYTFFTSSRNCIDQFISSYKHVKLHKDPLWDKWRHLTPDEWWDLHEKKGELYSYKRYLGDYNNKIRIKFFIRLESLKEDFYKFCDYYNFKKIPILHVNDLHLKISLSEKLKKKIVDLHLNDSKIHEDIMNNSLIPM